MDKCINIDRLIEMVRERPCLWDINCDDYSNRIAKTTEWSKILQTMVHDYDNLPRVVQEKALKDILRKWKSLRTCFTRELSRQKTCPGPRRKYIYYDRLEFLLPVINVTRSSNVPSNVQPHESFIKEEYEYMFKDDDEIISSDIPESQGQSEHGNKRKRTEHNDEDTTDNTYKTQEEITYRWKDADGAAEEDNTENMFYYMQEDSESEYRHTKRKGNQENETFNKTNETQEKLLKHLSKYDALYQDEDRMFLLSLSKDMAAIPSDKKLLAKSEILNVLIKYRNPMPQYPYPNHNVQPQQPLTLIP